MLSTLTSSVEGSSTFDSGTGDRGLIAYRQAHERAAAISDQKNPLRRPRKIQETSDYPFNNEIPFFRRNVGEYVSSDFGWRSLWGRADFHCGLDVVANTNSAVLAVKGGRVILSRSAGTRGGLVIYSGGRQYTYWHVTPARGLKEGSIVRPGQRIGRLANWKDNTHLHYSIYLTGRDNHPNARKNTNCVDPMQLAADGLF